MDPRFISEQIQKILRSQSFSSKPQLRKLLEVLHSNIDSQAVLTTELVISELWPGGASSSCTYGCGMAFELVNSGGTYTLVEEAVVVMGTHITTRRRHRELTRLQSPGPPAV